MGQGIQKCCEQRDDIPKEVVTHKFDENEKENVDEAHPTQPVKAGKLGLFEFRKVQVHMDEFVPPYSQYDLMHIAHWHAAMHCYALPRCRWKMLQNPLLVIDYRSH